MEEQVINKGDFSPNFKMPCMTLGDAKTCAAHYVAQYGEAAEVVQRPHRSL